MGSKNNHADHHSIGLQSANSFLWWGVSTLLIFLLSRRHSNTERAEEPNKNDENNTGLIGDVIPVILGRGLIKNPLVSYYGGFKAKPYTEEYGMHTKFNWWSILVPIIMAIIAICSLPQQHQVIVVTNTGTGKGVAYDLTNGQKNAIICNAIITVITTMLMWLFTKHWGRTTIQKGFKYYLGWQNILCWTGKNIGIKKLWMNVYDARVKESTQQGVWDNNKNIAWKADNAYGLVTHINQPNMFGGVDEGGGFVGDIRFYFGTDIQPNDPWMVEQMKNPSVQPELRGLTPKYPMYFTTVIPVAYIGKQSTLPEMWFEIVNYPDTLAIRFKGYLREVYDKDIYKYRDIINTINSIPLKDRKHQQQVQRELALKTLANIEKIGVYHLGRLGDDLNPAEAIYEILKNNFWGCDYPDERIDVLSLVNLGITCEQEGLGISVVINQESTAGSVVMSILNHINGVCYDDPATGKLTFRLIRPDYDSDSLVEFNENNCIRLDFSRLDWSETYSTISASFTDASHKYETGQMTLSDTANIRITHNVKTKSINLGYYTTPDNAKKLTENQLLISAYPLATLNIECNRIGYTVRIGDPISVSWDEYGIHKMVFRVTSIDYGSINANTIKLAAVEDVFGFDYTRYIYSRGLTWTKPNVPPFRIERYCYLELPYEMSGLLDSFLYVVPVQPSEYSLRWDAWLQSSGEYKDIAQASVWGFAGKLVYEYKEDYTVNDDVSLEISPVGTNSREAIEAKMGLTLDNDYTYNNRSGTNLALIDDEIISYNGIKRLPNGNYILTGVIRGVYDTIPTDHNTESLCYFLDNRWNIGKDGRPIAARGHDSTNKIMLLSSSQTESQKVDESNAQVEKTIRRAERPSIMAYFQYGADEGKYTEYNYHYLAKKIFSGDLVFKFNPRNKFNNTQILSPDEDIDIELSDTYKYVLEIQNRFDDYKLTFDSIDKDHHNVKTLKLTWAKFCQLAGNNIQPINNIIVHAYSYDDEDKLRSYMEYKKELNYRAPRLVDVIADKAAALALAKELIYDFGVRIPENSESPLQSITYDECPIILIGTPASQGIVSRNSKIYNATNKAFRIIKKGELLPIDIDDKYLIRSDYTGVINTKPCGYQYDAKKQLWKRIDF